MLTPVWLAYPHNLTTEFIDAMEGLGEDVSHAAILLPDTEGKLWVYEAVGTGFQKVETSAYDGIRLMEYLVDIPDISRATEKAESMLGHKYSPISCIEGFLHDTTGLEITQGSQAATNCSESVAIIVRYGNGVICGDTPEPCITPEIMQEYFDSIGLQGEMKNGIS
jgi:hypothetical protein